MVELTLPFSMGVPVSSINQAPVQGLMDVIRSIQ